MSRILELDVDVDVYHRPSECHLVKCVVADRRRHPLGLPLPPPPPPPDLKWLRPLSLFNFGQ